LASLTNISGGLRAFACWISSEELLVLPVVISPVLFKPGALVVAEGGTGISVCSAPPGATGAVSAGDCPLRSAGVFVLLSVPLLSGLSLPLPP